ncbi:hypothetical protein [Aeromicrobium sp. Leaf350]|uniref:hypothetical protein n=1 Tax=Aeromicrobium sp. Leaf350 TaxID=2876565 RepID=UPI001E320499|nr:hypothetical protein [Aeromicrobium sp. Leaf350]
MTPRSSGGAAAAVLVVLLSTALAACGSNDGGQTRCAEFALMSDGERSDVVEKLLEDETGETPTQGTVDLTVTAANYHCLAPESADDLVQSVIG